MTLEVAGFHSAKGILVVETSSALTSTSLYTRHCDLVIAVEEADMQTVEDTGHA